MLELRVCVCVCVCVCDPGCTDTEIDEALFPCYNMCNCPRHSARLCIESKASKGDEHSDEFRISWMIRIKFGQANLLRLKFLSKQGRCRAENVTELT